MNERMIKLYQQALEFAYENVSKEIWNTDNFHAIVAGKFAELIVQECIGIVEAQKESLCENQAAWSHDDYGYERAVNDSVDMVKKHFGVEE
jgi:hypothetical protein